MRRGLLSWSEQEVPPAVLEGRVGRMQQAMQNEGLDAALIYTNFPRPAAVSYLTHFVPYWSQGALLVPPTGMPGLYVNLSKRVAGWMKETAHVEAVVSTPRLGQTLGQVLARIKPADARLGVVELPKFPASVLGPLASEHGSLSFHDASAAFAAIRNPADDVEVALSRRAGDIARSTIEAACKTTPETTSELAAIVEYAGRTGGAEEIIIDVCADLSDSAHLRRFEGDEPLANRYAVRASVAYKGHWVRYGRTINRSGNNAENHDEAINRVIDSPASATPPDDRSILVEACTGCSPLTIVAQPPDGAVLSVTVSGTGPDGHWTISEPLVGSAMTATLARLLV